MQRSRAFRDPRSHGWQIRWTEKTPDGKRRFRQKGGFVSAKLAEAYRDAAVGHAESRVSLGELVDRHLAVLPVQESTRRERRRRLGLAVEKFGSELNPSRLTVEEVEAFREGLSSGQRFEAVAALKQAYSWGVRAGLLSVNPIQNVKNRRPKPKEIQPFKSWDEVMAVAAHLGDEGGIVVFACGTGLRPGELVAARWDDLDLDADAPTIHVQRALTLDAKIDSPKNGVARRVVLRRRVVEMLKALPRTSPLIFPAADGGYIDREAFGRKRFSPAVERAGLQRRTFYACRHTFASWAIAAGVETFQLARTMGTGLSSIERSYGSLLPSAEASLLTRFEAFDGA